MRIKNVIKAALLLTGAAIMIVLLWLTGLVAFAVSTHNMPNRAIVPLKSISDNLVLRDGEYSFTEQLLLDSQSLWAILIDAEGNVVWSDNRPEEIPQHYSINQVAAFSKWYLEDYPVQCRIRGDGLLVVGAPKNSVWKYTAEISQSILSVGARWAGAMLLLSLGCVVGLSYLLLGHWFKSDQRRRDAARSDWINGISHDIRTPLSLVMGYAAELERDTALPEERRRQAGIILSQSKGIKTLVQDLNLTMRLDYEMQPLRPEAVNPVALMRQAAADLINSGVDECFELELRLPDFGGECVLADAALLSRALKNLLDNCVRHNPEGCKITLGVERLGKDWLFLVKSLGKAPPSPPVRPHSTPSDGESAHGTGLKLVGQIARAHGGSARFLSEGESFVCELRIPRASAKK